MVVAESADALGPLLDRYDGTIVGSLALQTDDHESYLVRIDPNGIDSDRLGVDLARTNPDLAGDFDVDADASLALLAVVAHEARELGAQISPNWVPLPHSIASGSTEEAPTGANGYDPDAFTWSYMRDGGAQDMGVTAAWQILQDAGRLDERVKIAIVDSGFMRSDDMPTTRDIVGGSWDTPVAFNCGGSPCPWHGTQSMLAAMAEPDNDYGTAGPAGPVAELVAVPWAGGFWSTVARMDDAIATHDPKRGQPEPRGHHPARVRAVRAWLARRPRSTVRAVLRPRPTGHPLRRVGRQRRCRRQRRRCDVLHHPLSDRIGDLRGRADQRQHRPPPGLELQLGRQRKTASRSTVPSPFGRSTIRATPPTTRPAPSTARASPRRTWRGSQRW